MIKRKWDAKGAIEGLPLQLIIMIVIAGIAITILVAWMQPWKAKVDLNSIEAPASVQAGSNRQITIKAWDSKSNLLSGVSVTIEGAGIVTQAKTTDSTGTATFTVSPSIPSGQSSATIYVTASYTGTILIQKTAQVTVTP
ncbi:MAG: hypothetical protein HZB92_04430 [Euryarchaeota archaeon]|nr:hypothetical protein [Euryarchaeota archaeon]